jgi:hypothetical protein
LLAGAHIGSAAVISARPSAPNTAGPLQSGRRTIASVASSATAGYAGTRYQLHFVRAIDNASGIAAAQHPANLTRGSFARNATIAPAAIVPSTAQPHGADRNRCVA